MFVLTNTAGASAVTPAASKTTLFVDTSGVPSTKSSGGTVTPLLTGPAAAAAYQPLDADLTGIAGLTYAADLSLYYTGSAWATYTITSVGRTLLAATTQAAQRTALGAADATNVVDLSSPQSVGGLKTYTTVSIWNLGTSAGSIEYSTPGGFPGIAFKVGDYTGSSFARSDFRSGSGLLRLGPGTTNAAPTVFLDVVSGTGLRCSSSNVWALGGAANLWTTVYATNATINTSDSRLKTEPRQLREAEFKAASAIARLPAVWRWLNRVNGDENCEPEGMEARKHFGPTVQAAIAVMEANGLDPFAYSFICYDEWQAEEPTYDDEGNLLTPAREAGNRYSFRKEELLCFIVRALAQEIDGLADRVAALEAKA